MHHKIIHIQVIELNTHSEVKMEFDTNNLNWVFKVEIESCLSVMANPANAIFTITCKMQGLHLQDKRVTNCHTELHTAELHLYGNETR